MTHHLPILTNSASKTFRACNRLFFFEYELLYRAVHRSVALHIGDLGHRCLEKWWLMARDGAPTNEWLHAALDKIPPETDPFDRARIVAMMSGYHARWVTDDGHLWNGEPIKVISVESEFVGPLINPVTGAASKTWRDGGKIDAIVSVGGRVRTVEHKTSSEDISAGSDYWTRLKLDSQISRYMTGARLLGHEPVGCIYDVLGKPGLIPLKATPPDARKYTKPTKKDPEPRLYAYQRETDETPDEFLERLMTTIVENPERYYARGEIVRLAEDEREAAWDTWAVGLQVRDSRREKVWPRNPDSCRRYGRTCEFLPVCTGEASIDDRTRYRRADTAHEELTGGGGTIVPVVPVAQEFGLSTLA
jgi:hypothetical protein